MNRRLYRSRDDRMIFGVCGGLAKHLDIDASLVRIAFVALTLFGGAGIIIYLAMAIIVPIEGTASTRPSETVKENVEDIKKTATEAGEQIRSAVSKREGETEEQAAHRRRVALGTIIVIVGVLILFANFGWFSWWNWGRLWPLVLILIGLAIIASRSRRK